MKRGDGELGPEEAIQLMDGCGYQVGELAEHADTPLVAHTFFANLV
jgi:hypothetical protein